MSRKSQTVATFSVRFQVPTGYSVSIVQDYINEALAGWRGGRSPEDPLFNQTREDFTVKLIKKETTYGQH